MGKRYEAVEWDDRWIREYLWARKSAAEVLDMVYPKMTENGIVFYSDVIGRRVADHIVSDITDNLQCGLI